MASPLPILVGVGLLFLVASGNKAKAAPPAPPVDSKKAYDLGYAVGYADGLAGNPENLSPESLPEAAASGDAPAFSKGYHDGYAAGVKDKKPAEPVIVNCTAPGVTMTMKAAQQILIARGFLGKGLDTGTCDDQTKSALSSYQASKGITVTSILDLPTEKLLSLEPVPTPETFFTEVQGYDDGLNLRAKKTSNAIYVKGWNKGMQTRGYEDFRTSGGGAHYSTNYYYELGWNAAKNGEPNTVIPPY